MKHTQFSIQGKQVDIFPGTEPGCPAVYLNLFQEAGRQVREELDRTGSPDHSLVVISGLDWNHDMAPWAVPPISKEDTACTPGADAYLKLLSEEILPRAEEDLPGEPAWRGLTGYSLAGLFAIYAIYHTDLFSRIGSMSGSLWFPGFPEYAMEHEMVRRPDHIYLSLGDLESRAGNAFLRPVQPNTEKLAAWFQSLQIDTLFELNPGNHFIDPVQRTARGIHWLLTR